MIEVNEYVRTNKGNIGKVVEIRLGFNKDTQLYQKIYMLDNGLWTILEYIVKHSKQLIDLIEVGDIINSCIVVGFGYECVNGNKEKSILVEGKYTKVNFALLNWDIETILTKEQMEANCYKVGGEE